MEKTLASGAGLTARQEQFLAVVLRDKRIAQSFYLTGGTALSCWYLHHRESYDLDFFARAGQPNPQYLVKWFSEHKKALRYREVSHKQDFGFQFFTLIYPNDDTLKVDFSYYPSEQLKHGIIWKGLLIDSLYDIALNKFMTIAGSPRGRDYVDLYCILARKRWSLGDIRRDTLKKFSMSFDSLHLVRQFLRSVEFLDLPRMLRPFNRKNMDIFYKHLAQSLKPEILTP